uniref:Integrase, catalytic region, zinc finger, CCHC-type, peptidase aspartic, catalytic n=1 Tax=Tanacetum cinerariifolium TaxID=118510 RepID=A0A6L2MG99_TANCI|nr:integrase, catalytic region, zinc finger, CCHC-type, peptidase aspartic, catalytic [Tanacetum cinerariifolium]
MANLSEDIQCAGSDTRPPMLDRTDFASWQQRIRIYCWGKENGANILKSIDEGPYQIGTVREPLAEGTEGAPQLGPERPRVYFDLSPEEKDWYNDDIRATNIYYFKGYPRTSTLSSIITLMQKTFGTIFVTAVKLNRGLRDSNYNQLYAYLKQHKTHAKENKMMLERFSQHTVDPLALMSNISNPQRYSPSSSTSSSTQVPQHLADNPHLDSCISLTENLIENLTNTLALLTQSYKTFLPQTNNQLRTSSNARNQATVQEGRVVGRQNRGQGMNPRGGGAAGYGGGQNRVGNGRQNRGQGMNPRGGGAAGYGGVQNRVGNVNAGQASPAKCYNCNGAGHIARNCTQPKQPQNSEYYKDKMLLMQAQENGVALDAEQLLFLAGGHDNAFDDDVDEQPVQDLALNVDNVFQANDCDAFDSNMDEAPTAQTMFMANMSSVDPVTDKAGPSYDSDILSKVRDHDHYQDAVYAHHEEHAMHDSVQLNHVVDSHADYTSDSNMITYDQYVKDNEVPVIHSDVSSIPNDAFMMIYNDRPKPYYNELNKVAIGYKNPLCLTRAKKFQPALYNGHEIIKDNHAPAIVHNTEDTLEIAEITRKKVNDKIKDPECVTRKVKISPHDYSKENFLATFTPQKQLNPKQIFWSQDLITLKSKAIKEQTTVSRPIKALTVITPTGLTEGERGFEQLKECYLKEVILFFKTLKDNFKGIQKALAKEIKDMKDVFKELEAKVAQNVVDRKHDAIEWKNLLIENDNLIVECLSKEVFSVETNSKLNLARFTEMYVANTLVEACCLELEAELANLHNKRVKHYTNASGSQPRSNTKKNRISPAKGVNKLPVEEQSRTNKSVLRTSNRVDSSRTDRPLVFGFRLLKHITKDRSQLMNFMKKFIGTVRFENDHFGAIMGYGDYVIGDSVISMVYYVEGLGHDLFSIWKFCDSDLEVAIRKHSCYVRDTNEAMATACYTQNRSLIHTRHHKTLYELVHNKKHDLTFFRVLGALCYPINDSEDLGKLQPTTDIGIFVGYAPSRKGYRNYNKGTRRIMETIRV